MSRNQFNLSYDDLEVVVRIEKNVYASAEEETEFLPSHPEQYDIRISIRSIEDESGNKVSRPDWMTYALLEKDLYKQYQAEIESL